ncbi:heme peroxidase [Mycena rosella]|uniref:Peroxidase n=1 Tax=Mycena rosella TaxID=1033263 RepID=A0AAD7DHL3_MYCRO|nr:heme peroxidase [Mycena rosella]
MRGVYHSRTDLARASVRLAFHDAGMLNAGDFQGILNQFKAGPFSLVAQAAGRPNGAADGSLLTDPDEVLRPENNGLGKIVAALQSLPVKFNVSPGDVLHLAGTLSVFACPGGPVIKTPVPILTARFADMGFSVRELMAIIGAHITGKQRLVNTAVANSAFDSIVDIWGVRFYSETQSATAAPAMSTYLIMQQYRATTTATGQDYSAAHEKMSLLGIDKNTLTDCSEILPLPIDLKNLAVGTGSGKAPTDPAIDPAKLEAAIQQYKSIWL